MSKGTIQVICGSGKGKTTAALGRGISALTMDKNVIMIQFLKGSQELVDFEVLKRLEPEFKIFRFEKSDVFFRDLSEEEKKEESVNIRNALNFAKKVLTTGECDVLILDELLGLIDEKIICPEECLNLLQSKDEEMDVILTGAVFPDELEPFVDCITSIDNVKVDNIIS